MFLNKCISLLLIVSFWTGPIAEVYADDFKVAKEQLRKLPKPRKIPTKLDKLSSCELNFVSFLQGRLPAELQGEAALNMWDELFDVNLMMKHFESLPVAERHSYLQQLANLSTNDMIYARNLSEVSTELVKNSLVDLKTVKNIFREQYGSTVYRWSDTSRIMTGQVEVSEGKLRLVDDFIKGQDITKAQQKDYRAILLQSKFTEDQIEHAIKSGLKLPRGKRSVQQFREYVEFIENLPAHQIKRGLKDVEEIFDFNFKMYGKLDALTALSPQKKFLIQKARLQNFEDRRFMEIINDMKLREKHEVISEIDELVKRQQAGNAIDPRERARLFKKLDEIEVGPSLKQRALAQAKGEREILKKLKNGCSSADGPVIRNTAKKFSRFRFALSLTSTPIFYYLKNKDKLDSDPYWFERLGYEMAVGLVFTWVANRLFSNQQSSMLSLYLKNYVQFGSLDLVFNSFGYNKLFGAEGMVRYFQSIYSAHLPPNKLEEEYQKMISSPTFEKDVAELFAFLEERSKDHNTKNFIEKYLNFGTYSQLDDQDRITIQDMESPEGKEMLMELLAERMYLQNMGNMPFFQTGHAGNDRWLFYRARAVVWDVKGVAMNLAMFQLMCREPFGKVGSWAAVVGLVLANEVLSSNFTYGLRREAINQ